MTSIYEFQVKDIRGAMKNMSDYKGKVLLIVNVASKCGYTNQYTGLENLQKKYGERGLVVLGFPCNQFGAQEPGTEADIQQFCSLQFNVTFPMFAKVDVNGADASPLWNYLKKEKPGLLGTEQIKWNFTKFIVDRNGNVIDRAAPQTTPEDLDAQIAKLL